MRSDFPKLACICCTYARPRLLAEAVQSYLLQDYPADRCELIILDDAGQYVSQSHTSPKTWHLVSTARRFRTLGEKRNASAALVSPDVDALVVWDDDDIYLPWTLRAHAEALHHAPWSRPSRVYFERDRTGRIDVQPSGGLFHPGWAFSVELFAQAAGYPFMQSGQDQGLAARFADLGADEADPLAFGFEPYLLYRWGSTGSWHLSALDKREGYARLGRYRPDGPTIERLAPCWSRDYRRVVPAQDTSSKAGREIEA